MSGQRSPPLWAILDLFPQLQNSAPTMLVSDYTCDPATAGFRYSKNTGNHRAGSNNHGTLFVKL